MFQKINIYWESLLIEFKKKAFAIQWRTLSINPNWKTLTLRLTNP